MNIILLAGIAIATYFFLKQHRTQEIASEASQRKAVLLLPSVDTTPVIEFSTTTPVPISTQAGLGKTRYTFNISTRWSNLEPIADIITVQIGYDILASIHPRASTGSQLIPVTVDAVAGGERRLAVVVKNIVGLEYNKAAAYADIVFGIWV